MENLTRPAVCGSPLRQLSPSEKQTLRSRIIKETPQRFYSNQSLFGTQQHIQQQQRPTGSSIFNGVDEEIDQVVPTDDKKTTSVNTTSRVPGFSENPILTKFIHKSINKEHEFHKLIINIVSLFAITLLIKFIKLSYQIYNNYKFGQQSFLEKLIPCDDADSLQSFTPNTTEFCHSYSFFGWNNWQFYIINIVKFVIYIMNNIDNIKKIINLIITFNIIVSTGKLISYSKRPIRPDDNNDNNNIISGKYSNQKGLSSKQKDLLGLDDDLSSKKYDGSKEKNLYNNSKPHQIILNDQLHGDTNNHKMNIKPLSTPYLFKSLQTPLKKDQQALENAKLQQQPFRMAVPSVISHGYNNTNNNTNSNNIFNTNPVLSNNSTSNNNNSNNSTLNNVRNMGYIPSNKYAYMMNSPSPMKKR
ncbi:hypothetical protein MOSE0_A02058 [Monosporozyma servazzii]